MKKWIALLLAAPLYWHRQAVEAARDKNRLLYQRILCPQTASRQLINRQLLRPQ